MVSEKEKVVKQGLERRHVGKKQKAAHPKKENKILRQQRMKIVKQNESNQRDKKKTAKNREA
jgi:hypothetical protein